MKLCWVDIRTAGPQRTAIVEEAVHQRVDGILSADPDDLAGIPPTVKKVLLVEGNVLPDDVGMVDVIIVANGTGEAPTFEHDCGAAVGCMVDVIDAPTLARASSVALRYDWSLLRFRDPTKIPLEIVLAAAAKATGTTITVANDLEEAAVILGVLEHGPDGVMLAARSVGEVTALKRLCGPQGGQIELVELEIVSTTHVGLGERACIDSCSMLRTNEGMLVGSHSKGMMLCVSETHPLPYMPTRDFRVNAGAVHSYTLADEVKTVYLSELRAGAKVLAVDATGRTRSVVVGRVKIETRPLLSIDAVGPGGVAVNLLVQDDWHVRLLGPGASVLNCTELASGSRVLGYLPSADRHVGYPIDEFCIER